jgi:hypothetical protein
MNPDKAAELLQIPERGIALLQRVDHDENIAKAVAQVQSGFDPRDVAQLAGLEWTEPEPDQPAGPDEQKVNVWQCDTDRCSQRNRVSTGSMQPRCPSCKRPMTFVMSVDHVSEIGHMRRTYVPDPGVADPLDRTNRWKDSAPAPRAGDD